ncbi:MAG: response regulator [Defluviitaleaceae bacterium]|nr:response regulator [Defluviitaleaceae bacterium]
MSGTKHSVLIIDDQKVNILELSKALRPDFKIFAAGNGRDALVAAEANQPDLILLDILMADMDGYEVIAELKKSEKTKNIPVIFITGLDDVESEEKGLALGAADYIRKPFSSAIVRLRVWNQIEMLEMNEQLKTSAEQLEFALGEAQEANKAKSAFLSNMSHEIRTPMNAIIGMGELLLNEQLSERQKAYVNDIAVSSKALLDIINDILDFSKIETGKFTLNPVDYDFNAFINQIESMFLYITQKKGLELRLKRGNGLPRILFGDDIRLRQVLTNIIGNAVKFTEKGYVRLNISVSGDSLVFEIQDTGIGIREEDQPKLFKAFEQVDKSMNRHVVGTGLGLIISKTFVEMMGGDIKLESEYGQGSTFTITIPVVVGSREQVDEKIAKKEHHTISAPDAKVLVVDDNVFNLRVACGLLDMLDIEAQAVNSGALAIELIKKNDYDIVFMDHMMPEMDGMEATARIREMGGKYELLPIVALTANTVQGAREMFLANGFNDFSSKPVNTGELVRVLEKWLPPERIQTKAEAENPQTHLDKADQLQRKAIITFVKDNRDTFKKLTDSLSSGDTHTAHRIAHTLKSSAGYLEKTKLQEASLSLELSLGAQPPGYTPQQLSAIEKELEKALRELEPIALSAEAGKPESVEIDAAERAAILAELKPLLEKSDFSASEFTERLQGITGMEELAERIDDYDFEGALAVLKSLE